MIQRLIQGSRGLGAVVAALEAEAEAIFEVFTHMRGSHTEGREGSGSQLSSRGQSEVEGEASDTTPGGAGTSQQG